MCVRTDTRVFLHDWFCGSFEPALWNKARHWCPSALVVCVFTVLHGMCVTCGCLWPRGRRGKSGWEEKKAELQMGREGRTGEEDRVEKGASTCSH